MIRYMALQDLTANPRVYDCAVACATGEKIIYAGFRPRATRHFCFGESAQNHVLRVRGTTGNWSTAPNQDGSGTRFAQTAFAGEVGFGPAAQPRPTQVTE